MPIDPNEPQNPPLFYPAVQDHTGRTVKYDTTITLRDLFAAAALGGLCATHAYQDFQHDEMPTLAGRAYRLADAMLTARRR